MFKIVRKVFDLVKIEKEIQELRDKNKSLCLLAIKQYEYVKKPKSQLKTAPLVSN